MKRLLQRLSLGLCTLLVLSSTLTAQNAPKNPTPHADAVNIALRYLEKQQTAWHLTAEDVRNVGFKTIIRQQRMA